MTESLLTRIICSYKKSDENSNKYKWIFLQELYENPQDFALLNIPAEKREAYIEWLEPKLSKIIKNYDETRSSALHYFRYIFKLGYKTFLRNEQIKNIKNELIEYNYQKDFTPALDIQEEIIFENKKEILNIENYYMNERPPKKYRLWLIILALKCAPNLSDSHIRKVSLYSGIKEKNLNYYISQTKEISDRKTRKIKHLQNINNTYFIKNSILQKRVSNLAIEKNNFVYQKTKDELERNMEKTNNMTKRFQSIRNVISNKKIAEILNIRKSVVDYCIAHLLYENPTGFFESVWSKLNHDNISSNRQQTQKTGSF